MLARVQLSPGIVVGELASEELDRREEGEDEVEEEEEEGEDEDGATVYTVRSLLDPLAAHVRAFL